MDQVDFNAEDAEKSYGKTLGGSVRAALTARNRITPSVGYGKGVGTVARAGKNKRAQAQALLGAWGAVTIGG